MYQYLAWFRRGVSYPSGNKLLNEQSISKLKATLLTSGVEVHESVQRYDGLGRVLFTPIYADFDGDKSAKGVLNLVKLIESEFNISPEIFYSGNRGYHLFIYTPVNHSQPHLVVKKFMSIMCPDNSFDGQMYGSRHLLRSEGSIHFKSNLFKVKIDKGDVGNNDAIKLKAKKQSVTNRESHQSATLDLFLNSIYSMVDKDLKELEEKYKAIRSELKGEVAPCIKALISEGPVTGQNNAILTLIARNMNNVGVGLEDAIADVSSNPKWSLMGKEIISTFKSTYKRPSYFGCKGNELLKRNCDPFCPFNETKIEII
jgi:hypothetical protein